MKRKRIEEPESFIYYLTPREQKGKYIWPQVQVAASRGKEGKGLYTTEPLRPCTAIPFLGTLMRFANKREAEREMKRLPDEILHHIYPRSKTVVVDVTNREKNHPYNQVGAQGLSILNYVNEPSTDEEPNMQFTTNGYLMSIDSIPEGKELLACYGPYWKRNYEVSEKCQKSVNLMPPYCSYPMSVYNYTKKYGIQEPTRKSL